MSRYELFEGDCLEYMNGLKSKSIDAVVTDPPYPGLAGGVIHSYGGVHSVVHATKSVGTPWGNDLSALEEIERIARLGAIVFCSWQSIGKVRDALGGNAVGLVTWYKRNSQPSLRNRPWYQTEHIWLIEYTSGMNWKPIKTFYDIPGLPAGCFASERVLGQDGETAHPTQKPVRLMNHLVDAIPSNSIILDPFMGLGTTGVSCMRL